MTKFALILSLASNRSEVELTCAISGDNNRWIGTTRVFANKTEAEDELRNARILPLVGPDVRLEALNSGITVAFFIEQKAAVELQTLHRADPQKHKERTFVTFHDQRDG